jgi:hypothetical protein
LAFASPRHPSVGLTRKNALFAGSDGGAEHWAAFSSLIETRKLLGGEPYAYADQAHCCRISRWRGLNDRRVRNGIFFVLRTGSPWRDLSEHYVPYSCGGAAYGGSELEGAVYILFLLLLEAAGWLRSHQFCLYVVIPIDRLAEITR